MQTQGKGVSFDWPANFDHITPEMIDGFTPVIINVVPITNIPLLLGIVEPDPLKDPPQRFELTATKGT